MANICVTGNTGVGVCPNHSSLNPYVTTLYTGAPTASSFGQALAIVGSLGISTCGHPTTALVGSSRIRYKSSIGVHRLGDSGANFGGYTMVTCSSHLISATG